MKNEGTFIKIILVGCKTTTWQQHEIDVYKAFGCMTITNEALELGM
jgi:hypothetical protein